MNTNLSCSLTLIGLTGILAGASLGCSCKSPLGARNAAAVEFAAPLVIVQSAATVTDQPSETVDPDPNRKADDLLALRELHALRRQLRTLSDRLADNTWPSRPPSIAFRPDINLNLNLQAPTPAPGSDDPTRSPDKELGTQTFPPQLELEGFTDLASYLVALDRSSDRLHRARSAGYLSTDRYESLLLATDKTLRDMTSKLSEPAPNGDQSKANENGNEGDPWYVLLGLQPEAYVPLFVGLLTALILVVTINMNAIEKRRETTRTLIDRYNRNDMLAARSVVYSTITEHFRKNNELLDYIHNNDYKKYSSDFGKIHHYFDDLCNLYAARLLNDRMARSNLQESIEVYLALFDLLTHPTHLTHDKFKAAFLGWDVFLRRKMRCVLADMRRADHRWRVTLWIWYVWWYLRSSRLSRPWRIPDLAERRRVGTTMGEHRAEEVAKDCLRKRRWPVDLTH